MNLHQSRIVRLHLYPFAGSQYLAQILRVRICFPRQPRLVHESRLRFFPVPPWISFHTITCCLFSFALRPDSCPSPPDWPPPGEQYQCVDVIPASDPLSM